MFVPIRRDPIVFREKSYSDASALQKNVRIVEKKCVENVTFK